MERKCQHCNRFKVSRPRGLCFTCHGIRNIRIQYATCQTESRKRAAEQDKRTERADIPIGFLPCLSCSKMVSTPAIQRVSAFRIGCPWTICHACKEKAAEAGTRPATEKSLKSQTDEQLGAKRLQNNKRNRLKESA